MRRALVIPAVLAVALLALPQASSALPTVKFKANSVPIKGYPHTGNILGAGAALHAEYEISGTEYGGFPPPLIGINVYLPSGTKLHPSGFATCAKTVLQRTGSSGCSSSSAAGPVGSALGIVTFGDERVEEHTELHSYYGSGGELEFLAQGHSPVSLEILWSGHYANLAGHGAFGPELISPVPLVSTVPGAPLVSIESINVIVGSARKSAGKPVYYGTVPSKCPKGGFPLKSELTFDENGADPAVPETVTATYKSPCPKKPA